MSFTVPFALLSHDDDLHRHENLSVQSYETCDSPSIAVIQTSSLRGNYLFRLHQCFTNHVTITL
jgi:hypothetical protein